MPLNLCTNGHITGFKNCSQCGSETTRSTGTVPPSRTMAKKRIDRAIREAGGVPLADIRRREAWRVM